MKFPYSILLLAFWFTVYSHGTSPCSQTKIGKDQTHRKKQLSNGNKHTMDGEPLPLQPQNNNLANGNIVESSFDNNPFLLTNQSVLHNGHTNDHILYKVQTILESFENDPLPISLVFRKCAKENLHLSKVLKAAFQLNYIALETTINAPYTLAVLVKNPSPEMKRKALSIKNIFNLFIIEEGHKATKRFLDKQKTPMIAHPLYKYVARSLGIKIHEAVKLVSFEKMIQEAGYQLTVKYDKNFIIPQKTTGKNKSIYAGNIKIDTEKMNEVKDFINTHGRRVTEDILIEYFSKRWVLPPEIIKNILYGTPLLDLIGFRLVNQGFVNPPLILTKQEAARFSPTFHDEIEEFREFLKRPENQHLKSALFYEHFAEKYHISIHQLTRWLYKHKLLNKAGFKTVKIQKKKYYAIEPLSKNDPPSIKNP